MTCLPTDYLTVLDDHGSIWSSVTSDQGVIVAQLYRPPHELKLFVFICHL